MISADGWHKLHQKVPVRAEGAIVGLGFFAFGFGLMYFRYALRLAELLSI
jgi:hypothetical protein